MERGTFKECVVNINFWTYVVYMFVYVHQLYDTYVLRNTHIYIYTHDVHYVSIGIRIITYIHFSTAVLCGWLMVFPKDENEMQ